MHLTICSVQVCFVVTDNDARHNAFGVFRFFDCSKRTAFIRACALVSPNTVMGDVLICTCESTFFSTCAA